MGTEAAQKGLTHLMLKNRLSSAGATVPEMIERAHKWSGYIEALHDIEYVLTDIPKPQETLDEPSIHESPKKPSNANASDES